MGKSRLFPSLFRLTQHDRLARPARSQNQQDQQHRQRDQQRLGFPRDDQQRYEQRDYDPTGHALQLGMSEPKRCQHGADAQTRTDDGRARLGMKHAAIEGRGEQQQCNRSQCRSMHVPIIETAASESKSNTLARPSHDPVL